LGDFLLPLLQITGAVSDADARQGISTAQEEEKESHMDRHLHRSFSFSIAAGGAALAVIALTGCGGGNEGEPSGSTSDSAPVGTVVVEEREFKLSPSPTKVSGIGVYTFKGLNKGSIPHVLEVEGQGIEEETAEIEPGESATIEISLPAPGTYEVYCPLDDHKEKGMVAEFIVEP
jgi:plastocyanin